MTVLTPNGRGLGALKDEPDDRDYIYEPEKVGVQVGRSGGLTPGELPSIWDQMNIGSCTAHGSLRALCVKLLQLGVPLPPAPAAPANSAPFSRLEHYYNTRSLEGTTQTDSGAQVRDAIKALAQFGVAPESAYPYNTANFAASPPPTVEDAGRTNLALTYHRLVVGGPGAPMRTALTNKQAIVIGFNVPDYFEDASVWDPASSEPLPTPDKVPSFQQFIGGHCVALTYYDFSPILTSGPYFTGRKGNFFTADNSWGPGWGMGGRFNIDSEWFNPSRGLASDFWVIDTAE